MWLVRREASLVKILLETYNKDMLKFKTLRRKELLYINEDIKWTITNFNVT
jgi:hypothetical protein